MKLHDLTRSVFLCLSLMALTTKNIWAVTTCNGDKCNSTWEFAPSIPSSANGDVNYTFEFKAHTFGWASCNNGFGVSSGNFANLTYEHGTVGSTLVAGRGVAEVFRRDTTCYPGGQPARWADCKQSKQWTSGTTYDPTIPNGECSYTDGALYEAVAADDLASLINPVTETSRGYDSAGNVIWTLDFSYAPDPLPLYFFESDTDCGPNNCTLYSWGWSAYYKIVVWVKQGHVAPTIPNLGNPPISGSGSGGDDGSGGGSGCRVLPKVQITSPLAGSVFVANSTIEIKASAYDGDGTVSSVKFYDGTTLLATDTTAPYSYSWNTTGASSGAHTLTAKVTDNCNNESTSAPVNITLQSGVAPTVSLTAPSSGNQTPGITTITLSATAADSDGSVAKVEFFRGSTPIGTDYSSPYSIPWNGVVPGSYTLTAKATDNHGIATVSSPVSIVVNPAKPTVTMQYGYDTYEDGYTAVFVSKDSTEGVTIRVRVGYEATYPADFAMPDFDYESTEYDGSVIGTFDIPAGGNINDYFSIYIVPEDDTDIEGDETLPVTLLPDSAYYIGNDNATITIYDND